MAKSRALKQCCLEAISSQRGNVQFLVGAWDYRGSAFLGGCMHFEQSSLESHLWRGLHLLKKWKRIRLSTCVIRSNSLMLCGNGMNRTAWARHTMTVWFLFSWLLSCTKCCPSKEMLRISCVGQSLLGLPSGTYRCWMSSMQPAGVLVGVRHSQVVLGCRRVLVWFPAEGLCTCAWSQEYAPAYRKFSRAYFSNRFPGTECYLMRKCAVLVFVFLHSSAGTDKLASMLLSMD